MLTNTTLSNCLSKKLIEDVDNSFTYKWGTKINEAFLNSKNSIEKSRIDKLKKEELITSLFTLSESTLFAFFNARVTLNNNSNIAEDEDVQAFSLLSDLDIAIKKINEAIEHN